jgi:hypothetical protein
LITHTQQLGEEPIIQKRKKEIRGEKKPDNADQSSMKISAKKSYHRQGASSAG